MPIFLPDEPEFDAVENRHAWFEAVLLAEYGEQDGIPSDAEIPDVLNWLDLIPVEFRYDLETVECGMVYQSPDGSYACSVWDATGEDDSPWAVLLVDDAGARLLPDYCLWHPDATETERNAVLARAQQEIPDRAEAGDWIRPNPPVAVPDALRQPRPKENLE